MKLNEYVYIVNRRTLYGILQSIMMNAQTAFKAAKMQDPYIQQRVDEIVERVNTRLEQYEKQITEQATSLKGWDK